MKKIKLIIALIVLTGASISISNATNKLLKNIWEDESQKDSIRFKAINDFYTSNTNGNPSFTLKLSEFHYRLAIQKRNRKEEALALNEKAFIFYLLGYKIVEIN